MSYKKIFLLPFVFILLIGAIWWQFGRSQEPKISVEPQSYDFGDVKKATYSANFAIKNVGGGILKIDGALVSCGCTQTELSKKEIKNGEPANLKVDVDFSSEHKVGETAESAVYVRTNDPKNKEVTIEMKGKVVE